MELNFEKKAIEWTVYSGKTFGVQVRGWNNHGRFAWNVYALIFEGHPLHQNPAGALDLPLHCGATYNKRIVTSPANGEPTKWDKVSDVLKVGSDYAHLYDDHYEACAPSEGIPLQIQSDALQLAKCLEAMQKSMVPA